MKKVIYIVLFIVCATVADAQKIYISDISIIGNSLTKPSVIHRELPFKLGDTFTVSQLEKATVLASQNLLNTSLFNYVAITYEEDSIDENEPEDTDLPYRINIRVEERWYIWPIVDIVLEDKNLSSWFKKMDANRITYRIGTSINNILGLNHKLKLNLSLGYEKGIDFSHSNIALNSTQTLYFSWNGGIYFNKHVDYTTESDKTQHISANKLMQKNIEGGFSIVFRPKIRTEHEFSFKYEYSTIGDTILMLNPNYWGTGEKKSQRTSFLYNFKYDQRNYICYPTQGYFVSAGLEIDQVNNFDLRRLAVSADLQYYKKLSARWFWSSAFKLSASAKNHQAYIYDKAIGYDLASITGYDTYAIDGQHFFTQNNAIKFMLLPTKIVKLPFLKKYDKFNKPHFTIFVKAMFDAGYVVQKYNTQGNTLSNKFLFGTGAGVDLISYYDIVINFGYSVNSKGKGNFIFGFKTPIL